ncbi:unnamed protein product [Protopolystoma xenopodis]|uniref:Uncharacterized protein n=1 Tax=Protopolystoma xenopodis TaxID=117903 RepID=A0A448WZF6_9PLAT|nr:unnamed protein product [Protopolystoma xenopodis]
MVCKYESFSCFHQNRGRLFREQHQQECFNNANRQLVKRNPPSSSAGIDLGNSSRTLLLEMKGWLQMARSALSVASAPWPSDTNSCRCRELHEFVTQFRVRWLLFMKRCRLGTQSCPVFVHKVCCGRGHSKLKQRGRRVVAMAAGLIFMRSPRGPKSRGLASINERYLTQQPTTSRLGDRVVAK